MKTSCTEESIAEDLRQLILDATGGDFSLAECEIAWREILSVTAEEIAEMEEQGRVKERF